MILIISYYIAVQDCTHRLLAINVEGHILLVLALFAADFSPNAAIAALRRRTFLLPFAGRNKGGNKQWRSKLATTDRCKMG